MTGILLSKATYSKYRHELAAAASGAGFAARILHLPDDPKEPLPADSPLWTLPNVILSPHNASSSAGTTTARHASFSPIW